MLVLSNNNNKLKEKVAEKLSAGIQFNEPLADEPEVLSLQLAEFQTQFSDFCKGTRECMDLDLLKDGVTFDVLGPLRPYYMRLNDFISRIVNLHERWEKDKQNNAYSVIQGLSEGKKIGSYIENVVKCARTNMKEISSDTKCVSVLQILGSTFNQLLDVVRCNMYKDAFSALQDYIINLFDAVKAIVTEPLDNSVLRHIDDLLTSCLSQSYNTRLKQSAVALWKSAFASAKDLKYSEQLRKALTAASKKHHIGGFGDGTEFLQISVHQSNDKQMKAPSTPKNKTPNAANKKRVMALINDDSVDYVPIISSSAKKMKLTEHQKEMFLTSREQLPYMDEDSVQMKGNVLSNIKSQFDVDNSMDTLSSSLSRSTNAKISPSAQSSSVSEKADAPVTDVGKDSAEKTVAPYVSNENEDLASDKDAVVVASSVDKTDIDGEAKQTVISKKKKKRSVAVKLDFEASNKTNKVEDDDEISLAKLINKEKKNDSDSNDVNEDDVIVLSSSSSSADSIVVVESNEEGEMSKDSVDDQSVQLKSRRSLAKKAVPKKYKPATKAATETESKAATPAKKMGRPKKVKLLEKENSSKSITSEQVREDGDFAILNSADNEEEKAAIPVEENKEPVNIQVSDEKNEADDERSNTDVLSDEIRSGTSTGSEDPIIDTKSSVKRRSRRRKSNKSATETVSELSVVQSESLAESISADCSHPTESLNQTEKLLPENSAKKDTPGKIITEVTSKDFSKQSSTPEKMYSPDDLTTPEKSVNDSLITTPRTSFGVCHTPGILKKFDTPASERKRMRVHFRNIDNEVSLDGISTSNATDSEPNLLTGATPQQGLRLPIYKELSECTVHISKILDKLLPPNQAGANFVRNVLERKKIVTIGQLAILDSQNITSLPFRKPRFETVYAALAEYHKSISTTLDTTTDTESVIHSSQEVINPVTDNAGNICPDKFDGIVHKNAAAVEIGTTVSNTSEDPAITHNSDDIVMKSVENAEDSGIVESSQELPSTVVAQVKALSLSEEIGSINEKLIGLSADLPASLEINQLKEVLLSVTNTMMSLGSLQQKLMKQLQ